MQTHRSSFHSLTTETQNRATVTVNQLFSQKLIKDNVAIVLPQFIMTVKCLILFYVSFIIKLNLFGFHNI